MRKMSKLLKLCVGNRTCEDIDLYRGNGHEGITGFMQITGKHYWLHEQQQLPVTL